MGTVGEKRQRIRIEKQVPVADGQGGHSMTWALRVALWAHERQLSGAEALQAAQVTAVLSSVWEIWFRTDLSVKDRIVVGTRVIQIEAIRDPTDTRVELHLLCSEVQA